jgi:uncharacterized protein (TIGR03086 family)
VIFDGLARASAALGNLIDQIPADQWTAPTPCTQWSVRDVVNHLVGMNLVFIAMFEESPMPERGADRLGADPAGAFRRSAAALQAAATRPRVLERSQATPVGVATGLERLQWRIVDLLAHGWDIRQATGVVAELPDDLVEQAITFARARLPNQPRAGRFADPQPIHDNAPAIDRPARPRSGGSCSRSKSRRCSMPPMAPTDSGGCTRSWSAAANGSARGWFGS